MAVPRPFRFGVQARSAPDRKRWVDLARRCEDLGYACLTMPDHLNDQLAPLTALMCAADATVALRVGAVVLANDFRHPAVLAKELATLDLLSEGRLEIGMGAGWDESEFALAGMDFDPPVERIERLAEAVHVLKACFRGAPARFDGEHYRLDGLASFPLPVQRPHPPLLIGGGGRRVMALAGREADIVGINPTLHRGGGSQAAVASMLPEAVDRKVAAFRDAAGDRADAVEVHLRATHIVVTSDRRGAAARAAGTFGVPAAQALTMPTVLIGSADQIAADLLERRSRWGYSYITVNPDAVDAMAPVVARLRGT